EHRRASASPTQDRPGPVRPRGRARPGRRLHDRRRARAQCRLRRPDRPPCLPLRHRDRDDRAGRAAGRRHRPGGRAAGRGRRGRRPDHTGRLADRRQAGGDPGAQHPAGQRARLGDHRRVRLRRVRLGPRQPDPAPRPPGRRGAGGDELVLLLRRARRAAHPGRPRRDPV
ncbi:MAG: hypothetical protein AVDCRST_MAG60-763, partial [uncultured Nocardioides sp.]